MKHFFAGYIALCCILPYWYMGAPDITLFGNIFQSDWLMRDLLVFAGYGIAPCVIFIKDTYIRRKVAIAFMFQAGAQIFSKLYDDCSYDTFSTLVQGLVLVATLYYIYKPKKQTSHGAKS